MNKHWALAGAVFGVLIGLLVFAPARWLASALATATAARVQLADPRGTVWSGSARFVLSGGEGSRDAQALPGRLEWVLTPAMGGLHLRIQAACCTPAPFEATLSPGWRGWALVVADATSQWPAGVLAGLGAPWNTVRPQGLLQFSSNGMSLESRDGLIRLAGTARLDAIGISSGLSTLAPVGSYRLGLEASPQQGLPLLQLQTLEGDLRLAGRGQLTGSGWSFQGEASAAPEREPALGNLLNMVGRRQGARSIITLG